MVKQGSNNYPLALKSGNPLNSMRRQQLCFCFVDEKKHVDALVGDHFGDK